MPHDANGPMKINELQTILCMISILTPFNTEKYLAYLCQCRHSVLP